MSKNKANKYLASLQIEAKLKQEPKHMKEEIRFKIGDRVEVIKGDEYSIKGWKGKIIKIDNNDNTTLVDYDNGDRLWIYEDQLKLIKGGE